MRRLQPSVRAGHRTRLNGCEAEAAAFVHKDSPEAVEAGLKELVLLVRRMRVLAVAVRLPDFEQSIRHGIAVAVEHLTGNGHPLTGNSGPGQVRCFQSR